MGGSTPKFDCELPNGDKVKVKYGRDNGEIYAEVAASRLLNTLGFPADRMYVIKRVRCYGCPEDPYEGMQCLNEGGEFDACFRNLDYNAYHDFDYAVIERSVKGRRIETEKTSGWTWFELGEDRSRRRRGFPRAGRRASIARDLSRPLGQQEQEPAPALPVVPSDSPQCAHPVAMVQDLGATFGPPRRRRESTSTPGRRLRSGRDAATCTVSMHAWPRGGAGFPDIRISEEGRQFLATPAEQAVGAADPRALRGCAAHQLPSTRIRTRRDADQWVRAFEAEGARHRRSRPVLCGL